MLTLFSRSADLSRMIRAGISLRSDYVNVFETRSSPKCKRRLSEMLREEVHQEEVSSASQPRIKRL